MLVVAVRVAAGVAAGVAVEHRRRGQCSWLLVARASLWALYGCTGTPDGCGRGCNEASSAVAMRLQITRSYERQLVPPRLENQTDLLMWLVVRQVDHRKLALRTASLYG